MGVTGSQCGLAAVVSPSTWGECILLAVGEGILLVANLMLGIAGVFLNLVIFHTVFQFSTLIGNSPGLLLAWGILRDIANMILLFGFIFMGINTILNLNKYPTRKAIPKLLIFAILMNFSLFAAQAIIDVSNVLASTMYTQASSADCARQETATATGDFNAAVEDLEQCATNLGIAGSMMQASGLGGIFSLSGTNANAGLASVATYIGLALFATIGAVVFIAAGIMLVVRAITLTMLMVISPIGFAALAIPQLEGQGKRWWSTLLNQSFFAPILILLILVSIKITEGLGGVNGGGLAGALTQPNSSVMGVILIFALVIGFMVASLIAARKFGAIGASYAVNAGTKLAFGTMARTTNFAVNKSAGAARAGVQRGATYVQRSKVGRWYGDTGFSKSKAGKAFNKKLATAGKIAVSQTLGRAEKTNTDIRRIPGVGTGLKMIGATDGAKPIDPEKGLLKDIQKDIKERNKEYDKQVKEQADKAQLKEIMRKVKAKEENPDAEGNELTAEEKKFLAKKSVKELEELGEIKDGIKELVENLSPEQFEGLLKSEKLSDGEKNKIRTARYKSLSDAAAAGNTAEIKKITRNMSKSDLEAVPPELLDVSTDAGRNFLDSLSDKQRDDLAGSKKRTDYERQVVRDSSPGAKFEAKYNNAETRNEAISEFKRLNPTVVGKLDKAIVTQREIAIQLTPGMLMELQEAKKLSAEDIEQIAKHINQAGNEKARKYIGPGGAGEAYWS